MSKLTKESNDLYAACLQTAEQKDGDSQKKFSQAELQGLVQCTIAELGDRVNELGDHLLLRSVRQQGQIAWILRTRELAASMASWSETERMVFTIIEDADRTGVWIKKIKTITNIPPNDVQKAVAKLEKLGHVKGVRSIKAPAQRIYMLAHLAPSDEVTGGSFFDAGELDESLVEELCNLIIFRVRQESWVDTKRRIKREAAIEIDHDEEDARSHKRPRQSIEDDPEQTSGASKKRKHDTIDIEDASPPPKSRPKRRGSEVIESIQLAYPAGTKEYPTAADVHEFIMTSNAMRDSKKETLSVEEIQGLMDVLVWDDKLEQIKGGYRTVRGVSYRPGEDDDFDPSGISGNGLTAVPCGRCQITNLCQEGTRVSAATCPYWQDWLTP